MFFFISFRVKMAKKVELSLHLDNPGIYLQPSENFVLICHPPPVYLALELNLQ